MLFVPCLCRNYLPQEKDYWMQKLLDTKTTGPVSDLKNSA